MPARAAGASPARPGQGQGSRARCPQAIGTVRNGTPSRSAMPSDWAAVPARGSASTQTGGSVMDAAPRGGYGCANRRRQRNAPWPCNTLPIGTGTPR